MGQVGGARGPYLIVRILENLRQALHKLPDQIRLNFVDFEPV